MVPISVVIPTLNEEAYLEPLLKSLKPQLKRDDELIIVDSRSSDGTVKIARKYTKKVFFMPRLGIGPAKTFGARRAKNEVVAFLDADSIVSKDWLERTRRAFTEGIDIVYGTAIFATESQLRRRYDKPIRSTPFVAMCMYAVPRLIHVLVGVFWIPPNNCAFRRSIFLKAGGYGAVVCEDWDLAMRFKGLAGIKRKYEKDSVVMISDRRFMKKGFLRTVFGWVVGTLNILINRPVAHSKQYGVVR